MRQMAKNKNLKYRKMAAKFKVGDVVEFLGGGAQYNFDGIHKGCAKKGDRFTISCVSAHGTLYSVKGGYIEDEPNWNSMEINFRKVAVNWKERFS